MIKRLVQILFYSQLILGPGKIWKYYYICPCRLSFGVWNEYCNFNKLLYQYCNFLPKIYINRSFLLEFLNCLKYFSGCWCFSEWNLCLLKNLIISKSAWLPLFSLHIPNIKKDLLHRIVNIIPTETFLCIFFSQGSYCIDSRDVHL